MPHRASSYKESKVSKPEVKVSNLVFQSAIRTISQ